jgi:hypothetical protein
MLVMGRNLCKVLLNRPNSNNNDRVPGCSIPRVPPMTSLDNTVGANLSLPRPKAVCRVLALSLFSNTIWSWSHI